MVGEYGAGPGAGYCGTMAEGAKITRQGTRPVSPAHLPGPASTGLSGPYERPVPGYGEDRRGLDNASIEGAGCTLVRRGPDMNLNNTNLWMRH